MAGSTGGAVTLYDTETGHEVAGFNAGESEFRQLAFSRDGNTLVALGPELLRVWRAPSRAEIEAAENSPGKTP